MLAAAVQLHTKFFLYTNDRYLPLYTAESDVGWKVDIIALLPAVFQLHTKFPSVFQWRISDSFQKQLRKMGRVVIANL